MCRGFGAAAANGAGGEHGREVCRHPAAWASVATGKVVGKFYDGRISSAGQRRTPQSAAPLPSTARAILYYKDLLAPCVEALVWTHPVPYGAASGLLK